VAPAVCINAAFLVGVGILPLIVGRVLPAGRTAKQQY